MSADNGAYRCSKSPYALLFVPGASMIYYEPFDEARLSTTDLFLVLNPEDVRDLSFLTGIERGSQIIVAYTYKAFVCRVADRVLHEKQGRSQCTLELEIERSDFSPSMEMGFSSTSADELAELRTRRLLLNENPVRESADINAITRELFLRGMDTLSRVERSPFPAAFQQFRNNPRHFLEIAWILAVMQLILSSCVAEIEQLELTLRGLFLDVRFVGRRKRKYQNAPPYEIRVEGACPLTTEASG